MADGQTNKAQEPQLPLFYSKPVPIDAKLHATHGLKENFGFKYASKVNAVPINLIEMPQISHHYPVAFSNDGNATPVAILGLRDSENVFVSNDNAWEKDTYVPAYIRRYPFIFSEIPESDQLTLCVDDNADVFVENGAQSFFDAEGKPTALANNALEFCKSYHAAAQQTLAFSKDLAAADLLVDRQADIKMPDGKTISFSGFQIIDEEKLSKLDDKVFLEWRKKGWLPFVYAHLFSGVQWQNLSRLAQQRDQK